MDAVKVYPRTQNIPSATSEGLTAKTVILDTENKVVITSQTSSGMILTRTVVNKARLSSGSLLLIGVDSYNTEARNSLNNK